MSEVFISYSHYDAPEALSLAEYLRADAVDVWIDQHSIEASGQWGKQIVDAITECSTFVVMLSPHSVESHNVLKEVMLASEKQKRILPLELRPTTLPSTFEYPLAGIQRLAITSTEDAARAVQGLQMRGRERTGFVHGVGARDLRKSLMILPFEDYSPTQDNAWFAEGIVTELITSLSGIEDIKLIDEKTTREYYKAKISRADLSRELNVRYFIEGSVRKFGDQIKIAVQLFDVPEGEYVWTDSHRGVFADIFDIQEAVATKVVQGLHLTLTNHELRGLARRGTNNAQAYELHLRATEYMRRQTREGYLLALDASRRSCECDPEYYDAFYEVAHCLVSLYTYDPDLAMLDQAELMCERAASISHMRYDHLSVLTRVYMHRGEKERAEEIALEYVRLAPTYAHSWKSLGYFYYLATDPKKAIPAWQKTLEFEPNELIAYSNLTACYDRIGDHDNARRTALNAIPRMERYLRLIPDDESIRIRLANMYRYAGLNGKALEALVPVAGKHDLDVMSLYNIACLHAVLGDEEKAMTLLTHAVDDGFSDNAIFASDPDLKSLRDRTEFKTLEARVLAQTQATDGRPTSQSLTPLQT